MVGDSTPTSPPGDPGSGTVQVRMGRPLRRRLTRQAGLIRRARQAARIAALEEGLRDQDAFVRALTHDLRAPLRHLLGFSDLLDREAGPGLSEKGRHYLDTLRGAGANLAGLLEQLLAAFPPGAGEPAWEQVALEPLLRGVAASFEPDLQGRTVHWDFGPLPSVRGDRALLKSAFTHLLANALKATRDQPAARIRVEARERAGEVAVSVRDNGLGFDPGQARRLFVVFQKLHPATVFPGAGVGLAAVKRAVQRHGGRVWAEAPPEGGAVFHIALPRA